MKILLLGGCGFIGSNLAKYFKKKYPDYKITVFDNLQRRGSDLNVQRLTNDGIIFCHGDIRNYEDLEPINEVDIIIDASAEPSVLAGLDANPRKLINTNLLGSINCLEYARQKKARLIFLSSSRVYPIKPLNDAKYEELETRYQWTDNQNISGINSSGVSESYPLSGFRSIYGSTKLATEFLINEYIEYYNLDAIINRCSVISGPWQMAKIDQGFVALWLFKHYFHGSLTYNGYNSQGKQIRDVLHIDDFSDLIDMQIHNFQDYNRGVFNIGGGVENIVSLMELTEICEQLTSNSGKINSLNGWKPRNDIRNILSDIYNWIVENEHIYQYIADK